MKEQKSIWDVIIIGAGVSGLSAGMYCGRFKMKTLVLGEMPGGIITTTHSVENYPGILSINGADMGMKFLEHAQKFGAEIKYERVINIEKTQGGFKVKTMSGEYVGRTVIVATGTEHKKLGVPGEKEFIGKGVSYCALCDAAFFKNKTVMIVGGGDAAAIEAVILAEQCKKVYMIVRKDFLRAEPINEKNVKENPKIEILFGKELVEIRGKEKVEAVLLKSGEELKVEAVFMAVGYVPLSSVVSKIGVDLDERRQIKINRNSETNVPGVFAAGDITDFAFKQAITGAAQGVAASYFAYQFVKKTG